MQARHLQSVFVEKLDAEVVLVPPADLRRPVCVFRHYRQFETGGYGDVISKAQPGASGCEIHDFTFQALLLAGKNNQSLLVYLRPRLAAVIIFVRKHFLGSGTRRVFLDGRNVGSFVW